MGSNCGELKLINWNANGIKRQENEFIYFIKSNQIKIAAITETHLSPGERLNIPGYKMYRNDRISQTASGGVAILISNSIKHGQVHTTSSPNLETVGIKIFVNNTEIIIIAAYKPPNKTFPCYVYKEIFNRYPRLILMGDLNSKHTAWGCRTTTAQGQRLFNLALNNKISILAPTAATHFPYNSNIVPDILDILLTKSIDFPIFQNVLDDLQSDHNPVLITFFKPVEETKSKTTVTAIVSWPKFSYLMQENYLYPRSIKSISDLEIEIENFNTAIKESLKQASTVKCRKRACHNKSIPIRLLNLIKSKRNIRRYWQETRRHDIRSKLNKLSRIVKLQLDKFRYSKFQQSLKQIDANSAHLWSTVRRITGEKTEIPPLKTNNSKAYSDEEKTEILADHLEKVFRPHPITMPTHNKNIEDFVNEPQVSVTTKIKFISPSEVSKVISRLKTRKSPGIDEINNKMIKELNKNTIAALTAIFNAILRLNHFPNAWKTAIILPFRKPGKDPRLRENYRPISLLPTLSKIFERLILSRLNKYLTEIKAIPDEQFGFRPNHSCTHQLLRLTENIAESFHQKKHTVAVFLDIAQAYDRIWHTGLMYKLRNLGVPDYIQKIIHSFLTNRNFMVKVNETLSTPRNISAGLPQGSVLSPTLFNVYTSDIPRMADTKLALFADDTALFTAHEDIFIAQNRIQNNLEELISWTNQWRIKINPEKCQAKIFTLRRPRTPPTLKINCSPIQWNIGPIKYLGVHFDKRLTWKPHILALVNKAMGKMSKLYPIINRKSSLKIECQLMIFKSIILPTLTYACPVWGNAAPSSIEKLQTVQNKCLRKIIQAPWFIPNSQIHGELRMDLIKDHISTISKCFYTSLNISHLTNTFNLGRNAVHPCRIKSKFPKDKFRPP